MSENPEDVKFTTLEPETDSAGLLVSPQFLSGALVHGTSMDLDTFRVVLVNDGIQHGPNNELLNASVVEAIFHRPESVEMQDSDDAIRVETIQVLSRATIVPHWNNIRRLIPHLPETPVQYLSTVFVYIKSVNKGDIFIACRKLHFREARTSRWSDAIEGDVLRAKNRLAN